MSQKIRFYKDVEVNAPTYAHVVIDLDDILNELSLKELKILKEKVIAKIEGKPVLKREEFVEKIKKENKSIEKYLKT